MIWPFTKRARCATRAEQIAAMPMPECGDKESHYHWTKEVGWSCPGCAGIHSVRREETEQDRLAEKIAAVVVRKMNQQASLSQPKEPQS